MREEDFLHPVSSSLRDSRYPAKKALVLLGIEEMREGRRENEGRGREKEGGGLPSSGQL